MPNDRVEKPWTPQLPWRVQEHNRLTMWLRRVLGIAFDRLQRLELQTAVEQAVVELRYENQRLTTECAALRSNIEATNDRFNADIETLNRLTSETARLLRDQTRALQALSDEFRFYAQSVPHLRRARVLYDEMLARETHAADEKARGRPIIRPERPRLTSEEEGHVRAALLSAPNAEKASTEPDENAAAMPSGTPREAHEPSQQPETSDEPSDATLMQPRGVPYANDYGEDNAQA